MWWHGAEMCDLEGVVKTIANKNKVVFVFPKASIASVGRDYLHDVVIEMGYYMNKLEDDDCKVTMWADRPQAYANEFISESDIFVPNTACGGTRKLKIRGFGLLLLSRASMSEKWFVEEIQLLPREHMYQWESGAYFWFDYLPGLAKDANIDENDLHYRFVSQCSFDQLTFGER